MLSLILVIVILALITFLWLRKKYPSSRGWTCDVHDFFTAMCWVFGLLGTTLIVSICSLAPAAATESVIDNKIAMYQEENTNIEQSIDSVVKEYLKHEHDTFSDLKTEESPITLITLFPELKSDTLVQQQLKIYVHNNNTIKQLKEEKINLGTIRWLLYFGN